MGARARIDHAHLAAESRQARGRAVDRLDHAEDSIAGRAFRICCNARGSVAFQRASLILGKASTSAGAYWRAGALNPQTCWRRSATLPLPKGVRTMTQPQTLPYGGR